MEHSRNSIKQISIFVVMALVLFSVPTSLEAKKKAEKIGPLSAGIVKDLRETHKKVEEAQGGVKKILGLEAKLKNGQKRASNAERDLAATQVKMGETANKLRKMKKDQEEFGRSIDNMPPSQQRDDMRKKNNKIVAETANAIVAIENGKTRIGAARPQIKAVGKQLGDAAQTLHEKRGVITKVDSALGVIEAEIVRMMHATFAMGKAEQAIIHGAEVTAKVARKALTRRMHVHYAKALKVAQKKAVKDLKKELWHKFRIHF